MKIGLVMDVFHDHTSGVSTYVRSISDSFEGKNHEVCLYSFGAVTQRSENPTHYTSKGFKFVKTYYIGLNFSREIQRSLRNMDIVHLQHPFVSGPLALRALQGTNIPVVFTHHTRYDYYLHTYFPVLPQKFAWKMMLAYYPRFFRRLDAIIAPSLGKYNMLLGMGFDEKIHLVHNGIDLRLFNGISSLRENRFVPSDTEHPCRLIFVGRLGKEKNILFLLRAFQRVLASAPATQLVLVGDGPYRRKIEQFILNNQLSNRVKISGMLPYAQIPGQLAAADLFITGSISEVHPLTVIEAMASGLPVVAVDSIGIEDCVENGVSGLLSEHTEEDLSQKILELIQDQEKRIKMGLEAEKRAKLFSLENCSMALLYLYQKVIDQRNRKIDNAK